jgi:SWI/SNF-related matrix-associated actin-dependent regulator of chromatin subfamily A-like protein 1
MGNLKLKYPKYTKKFQKKGVRKINHFRGRALVADEMRLGKTLQTLLYCKAFPKRRPVIVVCPAAVKYVWQHQAWEHTKIRATVLEGRSPSKHALQSNEKMIILNYEILVAWTPYLNKLVKKSKGKAILVFDESHYVKSRKAKRYKALRRLSKSFKYIIAISGTPLVNRPSELWTTLNIIRPDLYPSFNVYAHRYCKPKLRRWGWEYKGASNIRELHRGLNNNLMIRRLRKDVLPHYKEPIREIVPLEISGKKEYTQAETNFIKWLNKKSRSKAVKAAKAERLVQMGYLARLAAELKLPSVIKWVEDFLDSTDEKIIICGIHQKVIKTLHKKFKKISVVVDGSVSGRKKEMAKKSFMNNKKIRIFIGQINAAGVGIDLSKANTVAFAELGWVSGDHNQFEDRAVHINKKEAISIVYLVGRNTIEEARCQVLQDKQEVVSSTLDGSAKANQLNLYDILEQKLKQKGRKRGKRNKNKMEKKR